MQPRQPSTNHPQIQQESDISSHRALLTLPAASTYRGGRLDSGWAQSAGSGPGRIPAMGWGSTIRARDVYDLRRQPAPAKGRWWRRLGQLVSLVTVLGPVPGGGEQVLIVERATGENVGNLR